MSERRNPISVRLGKESLDRLIGDDPQVMLEITTAVKKNFLDHHVKLKLEDPMRLHLSTTINDAQKMFHQEVAKQLYNVVGSWSGGYPGVFTFNKEATQQIRELAATMAKQCITTAIEEAMKDAAALYLTKEYVDRWLKSYVDMSLRDLTKKALRERLDELEK